MAVLTRSQPLSFSILAMLSWFLWNGTEYKERLTTPFSPPEVTLKAVHEAVPKDLLRRDPIRSTYYVARNVAWLLFLYKLATYINPLERGNFFGHVTNQWSKAILKSTLWLAYWWFQGLVNTGFFCLGHDAGHMSLYESRTLNNLVGLIFHSYLFVPYFSWRSTHHAHHKGVGSMEREENYVPYTRSKYQLPDEKIATKVDYSEVFDETPIYTLWRIFVMQAFGWWIYMLRNTMGNPKYPPGTNHFNPNSTLFKPHERKAIAMCNILLLLWAAAIYQFGRDFFLWYYLVPWVLSNHWVMMFTYLQHSDPTIPHYRKSEWSFLRGALATVDRPLLGWMGRYFLHNVSHDHIAHHIFSQAPFYNAPEITKAIKPVLKEAYNYDSTPTFYALYRSFIGCQFVEDEGDIVFYKNMYGEAVRHTVASKHLDPKEPRCEVSAVGKTA